MSDSKNISADVKARRKAVFMHEIRRICSYLIAFAGRMKTQGNASRNREENTKMDIIKELMNADFYISPLPKDPVVAMAYVPFQNAKKIYSPEHGFQSGTMFPELNKPFMCGAKERGEQND